MWIVQHCVVPPPLIFPEIAVVPGTAPVGPGPASLTYQYIGSDTSSDSSFQEAFSYIKLSFISTLPQRFFFPHGPGLNFMNSSEQGTFFV
jgi:hypothetical protein